MNKILAILSLIMTAISVSAQDSNVLKTLFDSSEIVVQGIIVDAKCIGYSLGVDECNYKLKIDSIYKGYPEIQSAELLVGFALSHSTSEKYEIIYFSRDCYAGENCPGRNQNVILFLKKSVDNNGYFLTDRWFGWQPYSYPLSFELGRLNSISNKK